MSDINTQEVSNDALDQVKAPGDPKDMSLEQLVLLLLTDRLRYLQEKTIDEFNQLKERQDKVTELHKILKMLNSQTNEKGELVVTDELKELLGKAKEYGVDLKDGKERYTKDERERLVENIRMTIEDFNVQNDMQLQTVTRLTNERYESFHMARSIMKPLHEDKINKARAVSGR